VHRKQLPQPAREHEADPAKSFWKDEMVSPFPVKYAKSRTSAGVEWEIGYMDRVLRAEVGEPADARSSSTA
jgi:hypothetical protein